MDRIILHCDLNNFYASVECMLHPEYKDQPVAVCGAKEDRHGIVLAKNMLAKKAGVSTGEPIDRAKAKCPGLLILSPHFDEYIKYSRLTRAIYERYTDYVEPFGMDECWLDVTGSTRVFGTGREMADAIRETVKKELGLTVSVGVSFNKIFAKLGSDMKKPDATTCIPRETFREQVWPLAPGEMIGVGWSTAARLNELGIHTIGELAATPLKLLTRTFGVLGESLWHAANGTDRTPVTHKDYAAPVKSVGRGITCVQDLETNEECWLVLLALAQPVAATLRAEGLAAGGIEVCVKDNALHCETYQRRLSAPEQDSLALAQAALDLFKESYDWHLPVRALTVRAISLKAEGQAVQYDLFTDIQDKQKRLAVEQVCDKIRGRFGKTAAIPASLLRDTKMPSRKNSHEDAPAFHSPKKER